MAFQKLTSAQRERAKARKGEARARFIKRVTHDAECAAFCFVACVDGRLQDVEVEFLVKRFGDAMTFASPTKESLARSLRAYLSGCSPTLNERQRFKRELTTCAMCDGRISTEEEAAIQFIADILGLTPEKRAATRRAWKKPSGADKHKSARVSKKERVRTNKIIVEKPAVTHWSYEYLGCLESDSDDTIKRCYRQLAVKLHPDKHAAKAKTPEDTLPHMRAFQKLQAAYDEVWRLRGKSDGKKGRPCRP